MNYIKNCRDY